jgi:hypothetical protein
VTEQLFVQQLESPSGTGRVEPRSDHQPGSPRKPGTGYQPTDRILTGSYARRYGSGTTRSLAAGLSAAP